MTNSKNWPNPERPGVPMFPERDGWHWLSVGDAAPIPVEWLADHAPVAFDDWGWALGDYDDDLQSPEKAAKSMRYHGPCLTSMQIAELLAGERERCAKLLEDTYEKTGKDFEYLGCLSCANEIRNLGASP